MLISASAARGCGVQFLYFVNSNSLEFRQLLHSLASNTDCSKHIIFMRSKWSKAFVIAVCVCSWGPLQTGMAQSPSKTAAKQAFKTDLMKGAVLSNSGTWFKRKNK
jgi:hypothetical protein